ncbi:MAG: hypothetical protein KDM63_17035 [Verrucomicrobiae bacterium]|nr:hypothetical protein [Verrucomicrobiae bacterium]
MSIFNTGTSHFQAARRDRWSMAYCVIDPTVSHPSPNAPAMGTDQAPELLGGKNEGRARFT